MTNAELIDLLREATSYLDDVVRSAPEKWKWTDEQREANDLMHRIDAALAGHADSAQSAVEWCAVGDTWATAYPVDGVEMTVMRWADGPWKWWTKLETSAQGTASTEEEAKSAAIAAARGMR
jgi:hypothetical protein